MTERQHDKEKSILSVLAEWTLQATRSDLDKKTCKSG